MKKVLITLTAILLIIGIAAKASDLIIESKTQSYKESENKIKFDGDVKVKIDDLRVEGDTADVSVNKKQELDTATFYDKPYAYEVKQNKKREVKANILKVSLITKINEKIIVVAPTTAVPINTGFEVALNVLPAPSFSSKYTLAFSKEGSKNTIIDGQVIKNVSELSSDFESTILLSFVAESIIKDEAFEKPAFIGKEVTGDRRFYNSSMLTYPYKLWKDSI